MTKRYNLEGLGTNLELGKGGPRLKASSGVFQARNSADSAFANVSGADATSAEHFVTKSQLDSAPGSGAPQAGVPANGLQLHLDGMNSFSFGLNQLTTWKDLVTNLSGTCTDITLLDSHLFFNGASSATSIVNMGTTSATINDMWAGSGSANMWFAPDSIGETTNAHVINHGFDNTSGWVFWVNNLSGGNLDFNMWFRYTGGWSQYEVQLALPVGEWTNIVVEFDSDSSANFPTVYYNKVAQTVVRVSFDPGGTFVTANGPLLIGNRGAQDLTIDGSFDVLQYYNRALSTAEIEAYYSLTADRYIGSALPLSTVLQNGNNTGASDIEVASAQYVRGVDSVTGSGSQLQIRGGDSTFVTSSNAVLGGDLLLSGGATNSTGGGARGGHLILTSGGTTAVTGGADAGEVRIFGATPSGSGGTGGGLRFTTGNGATGGANATAGDMTFTTGNGFGSAKGGSVTFNLGDSILFGVAADFTVNAGSNTQNTTSRGGGIFLNAGTGFGGGGNIALVTGTKTAGSASGTSGNYSVTVGANSHTLGQTGSMSWTIPDVTATTANQRTRDMTWTIGFSGISNGDAGKFSFVGGDTSNQVGNYAGSFHFTGGNAEGTAGSGIGGRFLATLGNGGTIHTGGSFDVVLGAGGSTSGNAGNYTVAGADATAGTGSSFSFTAGQGNGGGNSGNYVVTTQAVAGGGGNPGYISFQNDATSTTAARQGEFRVETDKSQFGGNYIGTRTGGGETADVTLTRIMTLVTVATNYRAYSISVTITGIATASADTITRTYQAAYYRSVGGATLIAQSTVNSGSTGTGAAWAAQLTISGNDVLVQVQGENGKTVRWGVQATVQEIGMA